MTSKQPSRKQSTIIAIAPNGARHTKKDHPNLPITPEELALTAHSCMQAGASMIHLHVRDEDGNHSLEAKHYRPALETVQTAIKDKMLIQVTSEAAGTYETSEQIRCISELNPGAVSIAIKEFFTNAASQKASSEMLWSLNKSGCLIQYILYSPVEVSRYKQLIKDGRIPDTRQMVLFVLGRYSEANTTQDNLADFIEALDNSAPWMVCAFGPGAMDVLAHAASLGGHIRIGFENGWHLADNQIATDNGELVRAIVKKIRNNQQSIATADEAMKFFNSLK